MLFRFLSTCFYFSNTYLPLPLSSVNLRHTLIAQYDACKSAPRCVLPVSVPPVISGIVSCPPYEIYISKAPVLTPLLVASLRGGSFLLPLRFICVLSLSRLKSVCVRLILSICTLLFVRHALGSNCCPSLIGVLDMKSYITVTFMLQKC